MTVYNRSTSYSHSQHRRVTSSSCLRSLVTLSCLISELTRPGNPDDRTDSRRNGQPRCRGRLWLDRRDILSIGNNRRRGLGGSHESANFRNRFGRSGSRSSVRICRNLSLRDNREENEANGCLGELQERTEEIQKLHRAEEGADEERAREIPRIALQSSPSCASFGTRNLHHLVSSITSSASSPGIPL